MLTTWIAVRLILAGLLMAAAGAAHAHVLDSTAVLLLVCAVVLAGGVLTDTTVARPKGTSR